MTLPPLTFDDQRSDSMGVPCVTRSHYDALRQAAEQRIAELSAELKEAQQHDATAGRLIDAWVAEKGRQIPWAKAVKIVAIVTKQTDEERNRLLHYGEENDGKCEMCGCSKDSRERAESAERKVGELQAEVTRLKVEWDKLRIALVETQTELGKYQRRVAELSGEIAAAMAVKCQTFLFSTAQKRLRS